MPKIINVSFYGAPGEKNLNQHVAMRSEETCPDCGGSPIKKIGPYITKCPRCHGDGKLTNLIEFCPEAPACASNDYPLGTWLKISTEYKEWMNSELYKDCCRSIIVIVTDRMAKWLNSENGKYKSVCPECHRKSTNENDKCICGKAMVKTRDLDLAYGTFDKLAPHSVGLIQGEVSVWRGGKWE